MPPRVSSQVIEGRSKTYVKQAVDDFYDNGDALLRTVSEPDYGVDAIIELFDNGIPTGKIAYVQIKGTAERISKLVNSDEVSCGGISKSNLYYTLQNRIPMILIYASISRTRDLYFLEMQTISNLVNELEDGKKKTVKI